MKKLYSNKLFIFIFLLPALILFCGVLIAPIGASLYYSFFDWKGIGPKTFIGLANYEELFTSKAIGFVRALRNSLLLAGLSVFLQLHGLAQHVEPSLPQTHDQPILGVGNHAAVLFDQQRFIACQDDPRFACQRLGWHKGT